MNTSLSFMCQFNCNSNDVWNALIVYWEAFMAPQINNFCKFSVSITVSPPRVSHRLMWRDRLHELWTAVCDAGALFLWCLGGWDILDFIHWLQSMEPTFPLIHLKNILIINTVLSIMCQFNCNSNYVWNAHLVSGGLWGPTRPEIHHSALGKHLNFHNIITNARTNGPTLKYHWLIHLSDIQVNQLFIFRTIYNKSPFSECYFFSSGVNRCIQPVLCYTLCMHPAESNPSPVSHYYKTCGNPITLHVAKSPTHRHI